MVKINLANSRAENISLTLDDVIKLSGDANFIQNMYETILIALHLKILFIVKWTKNIIGLKWHKTHLQNHWI